MWCCVRSALYADWLIGVAAPGAGHEVGRAYPCGGRYRSVHHAQQGPVDDRQDAPAGIYGLCVLLCVLLLHAFYEVQVLTEVLVLVLVLVELKSTCIIGQCSTRSHVETLSDGSCHESGNTNTNPNPRGRGSH